MSTQYCMLWGALGLAMVIGVVLSMMTLDNESKPKVRLILGVLFWIFILSCYSVCVAVVSLLLSHFFQLREWVAAAIALLPAIGLFYIATKWAQM